MSTTFDPRLLAAPAPSTEREAAPVGRPAPARPAARRRPARAGKPSAPKVAGRAGRVRSPRVRALPRFGAAGYAGFAILLLSLLGMVYLTQISHVARSGYLLSSLQDQQAKIDRENALLRNTLAGERTLARAGELAASYQMQSFSDVPKLGPQTVAAAQKAPTPGSSAAPKIRFVTVQRPAARPVADAPLPPAPTLLDRLWNRIVGIGTARAPER